MSREIKFRAWNPHLKLMGDDFEEINVCSHGIVGEVTNGSIKTTYRDIDGVWKDAPLMQYTGLKDKNGKEIYEGDIVRFDILMNRGSVEEHARTFENRVEFEKGCFFVDDWLLHNVICEVIGNIYEKGVDNP